LISEPKETADEADPALSMASGKTDSNTAKKRFTGIKIKVTEPTASSQRDWQKIGATPSEGIFLVSQYDRVTEATERLCWVVFGIEIFLFMIYTSYDCYFYS
jgi:hypothetical protein